MTATHASVETHRNLLSAVTGLASAAGEKFRSDLRASLVVRGTNPLIEFMPQRNVTPGNVPPDIIGHDGIVTVRQPAEFHLSWRIDGFGLADLVSLDPKWQYANGLQQLTAGGEVIGHAHLHVALLREWPDVVRSISNGSSVSRPSSWRTLGGHDWYRTGIQPDGSVILTAVAGSAMRFTPGELHIVRLDLMHIDDNVLLPNLHLQPAFSLTTIMRAQG